MKKIEHVFFDLDHTLWDFEKNSALTFQKIFKEVGLQLDFELFLQTYIPINLEYWRLYREEKISKKDLRYSRLKKAFDAIDVMVEDDLINKLSVLYIDNLPNFNHLFDGTTEILDYLSSKYTLHIITNGFEEVQSKKLKQSGIQPFFEQVITSESVGVKKPNPKVFNYALETANASIDNSIMIGDSFEADILGADAVGLDTIFCNLEHKDINSENFKTVNHLLEIKQYI